MEDSERTTGRVEGIMGGKEKLEKMTDLVQQNLSKAQRHQKMWYDKNSRSREFQPGDQVLVLRPRATEKLQAQWQGPYSVVKRVSMVD